MDKYGLGEYYLALEDEGLAADLPRLSGLSDEEVDELLERLEIKPAQVRKFNKLLELLRKYSGTSQPSPPEHSVDGDLRLQEELEEAKRKIQELEDRLAYMSVSSRSSSGSEIGMKHFVINEASPQVIGFEENKEKPNLEEAGVSYDSWKMRSALGHLDVEEMCRCLAKAIRSHIKHSMSQRQTVPDFVTEYGSLLTGPLPSVSEVVQRSFNEQFNDEPGKTGVLPDANSIYNLCKNIIVRGRMEKEVTVISLVYLERLVLRTGLRVTEFNWKRLLFTVLALASKTWDDESFENSHFAQVFSMYSIRQINSMECAFLTLIDYALTVKSSDYAKYYFVLRTYCERKSRSFPLKEMDVDTLRRLLKAGRAEGALKDIYREPLHKTL
jgi:hypothetical protein